jgi:hypothetical protein
MVKTKKYLLFTPFAIIAILPTFSTNVNGQIPKNSYLLYFFYFTRHPYFTHIQLKYQ